jgi:hypothetical protein
MGLQKNITKKNRWLETDRGGGLPLLQTLWSHQYQFAKTEKTNYFSINGKNC